MKKTGWMLLWLVLGNAYAGPGLQMAGVVVDENQQARPGVRVGLIRADLDEQMEFPPGDPPDWDRMTDGRVWSQRTNPDGEFRFAGLDIGKYRLTVMADPLPGEMEYAVIDVDLAEGSISNVCLLPGSIPRHVLRGILRSSRTGEPIQADLSVMPSELEVTPGSTSWMLESVRMVQAGSDGRFVKPGLVAGRYMVRVSALDEAVHGRSEIGFPIRVDGDGVATIDCHYSAYLAEAGLDVRLDPADGAP